MSSGRRTGQLHLNRVSGSDTIYFVTCCTHWRRQSLLPESVAATLLTAVQASDRQQDTQSIGFTIMPDHCHWVFRQGFRLSLGRIIAKFKSSTRKALTTRGLEWQRDFYEHRLALTEDPEGYALYTFLNPYRARLIAAHETWPFWWSADPVALRFASLLNDDGSPPAAWIEEAVPASICHGE